MKVFTVESMMAAEKAADSQGHSYATMMEWAGKGVADAIVARRSISSHRVLILVGPGNNGGDGLVAGRYLAEAGAQVTFYLYKRRDDDNFRRLLKMRVQIVHREQDNALAILDQQLAKCDILIDALLGTGVTRPLGGPLGGMLQRITTNFATRNTNTARTTLSAPTATIQSRPFVVAVDCPSGLNCNSGQLDRLAISADLTVTFAGPKRGHFIFPGAAACGELEVIDIGIQPTLTEKIAVNVATPDAMRALVPARPLDGHKGTFGSVMIAGGSADYLGAPILSTFGALRAGCGLVALAVPQAVRTVAATQLPEATYPRLPDDEYLGPISAETILPLLPKFKALLIGPGLGQQSARFLTHLFRQKPLPPLVLDADALNYLAQQPNWWTQIPPNSILTPHPGEMARLTQTNMRGQDRVRIAQTYAQRWQQIVVLKGAYTVIGTPDGQATIISVATPLLAVAGSGDVLAGIIASLLGQGAAAQDAAILGAYLHASAGKKLESTLGNAGLLARQIADAVPTVRRQLSGN